jgi:flagellar hook-basal body complex protein FliE
MMNRIEEFADNLKAESRQLADRAVAGLRTAGLETADFITRTKGPVHAFADTTLKFNTQTHKRFEKMLKQQVKLIDGLIDGSADRIEKVAKAKDVNALKDVVVDISSIGGAKKAPARKKRATRKTAAKKRPAKKAAAKKASTKKRATRKASAKKTTAAQAA